jgi:hypothetical protein
VVLTSCQITPSQTVFSMPFFDWDGESSSRLVMSTDLWIFWAVSMPLTAIVLLSWRVWWIVEDRKNTKNLEQARKDKVRQFGFVPRDIGTSYSQGTGSSYLQGTYARSSRDTGTNAS